MKFSSRFWGSFQKTLPDICSLSYHETKKKKIYTPEPQNLEPLYILTQNKAVYRTALYIIIYLSSLFPDEM